MAVIFLFVYNFFRKHRIFFILTILSIFAFSVYFASKLSLEENIVKMMPFSGKTENFEKVLSNSRVLDRLIINVFLTDTASEANPDYLIEATTVLGQSLEQMKPEYISSINYKMSDALFADTYDFLYSNLPVFLNEKDFSRLDSLTSERAISSAMERSYRTLVSPVSLVMKKYVTKDPLGLTTMAVNKLQSFQVNENYSIYNGCIFSKNRKNLLIIITPSNPSNETSKNSALINRLDKLLADLKLKTKNSVTAEYYGAAAVAVVNAKQLKHDISFTVTIALLLIIILVSVYFRSKTIAFLSFLPAVFGAAVALCLIHFMQGTVSAIALGVGSVILGIIVDYALYIFNYYRNVKSIPVVIHYMAFAITVCSLTTITAFFCLLFLNSQVLHDIGLFAGLSILFAAIFSIAILPQFLKNKKEKENYKIVEKFNKIIAYPYEKNLPLILIVVVISIAALFVSGKAKFDVDLANLNFVPANIAKAEQNLNRISDFTHKNIYLVTTGKNLDEAVLNSEKLNDKIDKLKAEKIVSSYSSVSSLLMSDSLQYSRIEQWRKFWTPEKIAEVKHNISKFSDKYNFRISAFEDFFNLIENKQKTKIIIQSNLLKKFFLEEWVTQTKDMAMVTTVLKVNQADKPKVYQSFANTSNLVIFDKQYITNKFIDEIRNNFDLLVKLSLIFVTLVLILSFGRLETGLIASAPMFLSWFWTLGIMGITGLTFNIFNIILTTFIFGLGVDYSVLAMRGLLQEYRFGKKELPVYKSAVFISTATTIIGVGVLIFAKHPALYSISIISVIGMLSVVFLTYSIVPFLFNWLILRRKEMKTIPVTLLSALLTLFSFGYFVIGSLVLTITGFTIFTIIPLPVFKKQGRRFIIIWFIGLSGLWFI